MKLPERLGRRSGRPFHSAIATSFAIEFAAVEEIFLPQLMASGATNLLLITDERMAALGLSDGSRLPMALGCDYALFSPPAAQGIFHPKIILQIGRDSARAFVSSANLTAAGLAGNAEVTVEIECKDDDSPERAIVRSIWRYLDALVGTEPTAARDALRWARERAAWIDGPGEPQLQELEDGSAIAFIHGPGETGIGDQFVAFIGGSEVESLVVISPYWDQDLGALSHLAARLAPQRIILPIDRHQHQFPVEAAFAGKVAFVDLNWPSRRFTHAKILVASTAQHDHVLFGSANCSVAALGRSGRPGTNAEACVYRRLPKGAAREALELDRWLEGDAIALEELSPPAETAPIPLQSIEERRPGTFELAQGVLSWQPAAHTVATGEIELLDRDGALLVSLLSSSFGTAGQCRVAPIDPALRPKLRFARLVGSEFSSNLAHVTHRDALRSRRREVASGSVARALLSFSGGDDFDLWMHQAFETLARADFEDVTEPEVLAASGPRNNKPASQTEEPVELSYEDFTQAKSGLPRSAGQGANSLAGTYADSIRDFLNLLSGGTPVAATAPPEDSDYDDPIDEEGEFDPEADTPIPPKEAEARSQQPVAEPVDGALYERHVIAYAEGLECDEETLGSSDVLRLRFWILLLLYKARCDELPKGLDASSASLAWPRLIVRVLVGFFCGRRPAIARLMVSRDYCGMPADFMECWITVLWSLDAIERQLTGRPKDRQFLQYVPQLRKRILVLLALSSEELGDAAVVEVRAGLDRSIGRRLGLGG
ncbi:hypothetical protein [Sphingobium sp. WCS2017Hpa-17]|uniref:hypothetical protein n=1 Tax=Sphingobium sp. WCS2017Hpa-17 TaxID=3073638 RepID=UPI00288C2A56|nr:hypothetical protein [Sphingobium sp. WCS2017Hpa-17]